MSEYGGPEFVEPASEVGGSGRAAVIEGRIEQIYNRVRGWSVRGEGVEPPRRVVVDRALSELREEYEALVLAAVAEARAQTVRSERERFARFLQAESEAFWEAGRWTPGHPRPPKSARASANAFRVAARKVLGQYRYPTMDDPPYDFDAEPWVQEQAERAAAAAARAAEEPIAAPVAKKMTGPGSGSSAATIVDPPEGGWPGGVSEVRRRRVSDLSQTRQVHRVFVGTRPVGYLLDNRAASPDGEPSWTHIVGEGRVTVEGVVEWDGVPKSSPRHVDDLGPVRLVEWEPTPDRLTALVRLVEDVVSSASAEDRPV